MKVEEPFAQLILEEYEKQRLDEINGEPFKGEFIGKVFSEALKSAAIKNGTSDVGRFEKVEKRLKWFRILFFITLAFFILMILLYRRSIRYA